MGAGAKHFTASLTVLAGRPTDISRMTTLSFSDYFSLINAITIVITAAFVGWQVKRMADATSLSRLQNQHLLCLEIWKQYNATFSDRQDLLENPLIVNDLLLHYKTLEHVVNSDVYKRLKRVAGVYVLAGALVDAGAIDRRVIYHYISVPPKLWNDHLPLIQHLREHYYPDLWTNWEKLTKSPDNRWMGPVSRQRG